MPISDNIRRTVIAVGLCALAVSGTFASAAPAAPDRALTPAPTGNELTWQGTPAAAVNATFVPAAYNTTDMEGLCGKGQLTYCEEVLVDVTVAGHLDVRLTDMRLHPTGVLFDDYDLFLYESDASGTTGEQVDVSAQAPGVDELVSIPVSPGYYLARIVYVSTKLGGYRGHVALTSR